MMVFGKQTTPETAEKTNSISTRTFHLSMNERRPDDSLLNFDSSSSIISKLYPIQQDNFPTNSNPRFESGSFNRSQTTVR